MAIKFNDPIQYDASDYTYDGSAVTSIAINGIHGHSFASGTEELIVVWNNHPVIRRSSAWVHQPVTLTTNTDCYMDSFLGGVFLVNGTDSNYFYSGSETWSTTTNLNNSPVAKFVKEHKTRVYLYNVSLGGAISKPSWVWYSDFPKNGAITWGIEYGTNLSQSIGSAVVTSAGATFITNNIKAGDPFVITTGTNTGEYTVLTVDSETQITLTTSNLDSASNSTYWVGGNYFEVATEDGDSGMQLAETSDELFCFKKNSLWRFNSISKTLRRVKTAPGTTSSRSVVESGGYVYWFHPSGIYRTQGDQEQLISNSIEDIIEGVNSDYLDNVCGWRDEIEGTVNMFLGNVTLRDGDMITNCVAVFDENSETMTTQSLDTTIKVATNWLETNVPKIYAGDTTSTVYQLGTGTDYNGSAIPFETILKPIFPAGSEAIVNFRRLRSYIYNGPNVQIYYKLLYKPTKRIDVWTSDEDWKPMKGRQLSDRAEWIFPDNARASGVQLKLIESSTDESFLTEKLVLYYANATNR